MSKNDAKQSLVVAIVFAAIVISGSLVFLGTQFASAGGMSERELSDKINDGIAEYVFNQNYPVVAGVTEDDDPYIGNKNAPVTMIEFSDYECPYCARFVTETLPLIKEKYIDTGKVKLVYRDLPLSFHPNADDAAIAAECAFEQGDGETYFAFHDKLYEGGSLTNARYRQYASDLELNLTEFDECLNDPAMKEEVDADLAAAAAAGAGGTPAFFINGRFVEGAQPFSTFQTIIERELANT